MPRDILIDPQRTGSGNPNIQFSGSAGNPLRLEVLSEGSVQFTGVSGSLFKISDFPVAGGGLNSLFLSGTTAITGSFLPGVTDLYDLGSSTKRWANIFATSISGSLTGSNVLAGQVVVAGTGGVLSGSNVFWWDNTNKRVGIGTSSGLTTLLYLTGSSSDGITIRTDTAPRVSYQRSSDGQGWSAGYDIVNNGFVISQSPTSLTTTQRLFINSGGYVGVGTVTPLARFYITGSSTASDTTFLVREGVTSPVGSANILNVQNSSGTSILMVSGSGKVGIGAAPAYSSPLYVFGNNSFPQITAAGSSGISPNGTSGYNLKIDSTDLWQLITDNNASNFFFLQYNNTSLGRYLSVSTTGNVGIGTTIPNSNSGYTTLTLASSTTGGRTDYNQSSTAVGSIYNDSSALYVQGNASKILVLGTNASEKVRIDTSGNVGIGTATPAALLTVSGTIVTKYSTGLESYIAAGTYSAGAAGFYPIYNTQSATGGLFGANDTVIKYAAAGNNFVLLHGTTVVMTANSSESVGIGSTTSISARFQVSGSSTSSTPTMIVREGVVSPTAGVGVFDVQNSAGTSILFVTGSQRVGIGTTAPQAAFHVVNGSVPNAANLYVGYVGSNNYYDANQHYYRDGSGNTRLTISSGGNVAPGSDNTQDLGSTALRWRNVYATSVSGSLTGSNVLAGQVVVAGTGGVLSGTNNFTYDNSTGNLTISGSLRSVYSVGDEGGEIFFAKPQTNTSINTGVTIDMYQNKIRIFETGGTNRGGYFDITSLGAAASTNLAGSGGATSTNYWFESAINTIYSTGSVGVGTNSYAARFFVSGSSTASTPTMIVREGVSSPTSGVGILNVQNSAGTSILFVSGSGNVGIGTATPGAKLHVIGSTNVSAIFSTTNATQSYIQLAYNTGTTFGYVGNGTSLVTGAGNTDLALRSETGGNILFASGGSTERVRIDTSGNVGIGTSSYTGRLYISGSSTASTPTMVVREGVVSPTGGAGTFDVQNSAGTSLLFVSGSGRVGIGTTAPYQKFTLYNGSLAIDAGTTSQYVRISQNSTTSFIDSMASGGSFRVRVNAGATEAIFADSSGNVGIGTTSPSAKLNVNGTGLISSYVGIGPNIDSTVKLYVTNPDSSSTSYIGLFTQNGGVQAAAFMGDLTVRLANNALRVDGSTGNVGIGFTGTTARLFVSGSSTASTPTMVVREGVVSPTGGAGTFDVQNSAGTTLLFVSGSGRIGIGTSSPGYDVQIGSTSTLGTRTLVLTDLGYGIKIAGGNGNGIIQSLGTGVPLELQSANSNNGNYIFSSTGNVGIGTATVTSKLHVYTTQSDATATPSVDINAAFARIGDATTGLTFNNGVGIKFHDAGNVHYSIGQLSGNFYMSQTSDNGNVLFSPARTDVIVFNSSGNVGIGSTTPGYKLDVNGDINLASTKILRVNGTAVVNTQGSNGSDIYMNARAVRNESSVNTDGLYLGYGNSGTTAGHIRFFANGTTERMKIAADTGSVIISDLAGSVSTSTARLLVSGSTTSTTPTMVVKEGTTASSTAVGVLDAQSYTGNSLFFVSGSGFVGIGTNTPSSPTFPIAGGKFQVSSSNTGTSAFGLIVGAQFVGYSLNYYDASTHIFRHSDGSTRKISLDSNGNVGIGNVAAIGSGYSPLARLMVTGSSDSTAAGLTVKSGLPSPVASVLDIQNNDGTTLFFVSGSGNVGIGTNISNGNKLSVSGETAITGSVTPGVDNTYSLGSSGKRWKTIYVATGSIANVVFSPVSTGATYVTTFASGESGRLTATKTINSSTNTTFFTVAENNGASMFDVSFVVSEGGFSVARKYSVASQYGTSSTNVVSFKTVDTGPYSGNDLTVTFTKTSATVTTCTVSQNSGGAVNIAMTIDISAISSGGAPTTVTIF